jgi:hypothetical protein
MRQVGIWLMLFGFGSMVLNFLGREFVLLMWIDMWGATVGWGIRILMAIGGVALFFLGNIAGETS